MIQQACAGEGHAASGDSRARTGAQVRACVRAWVGGWVGGCVGVCECKDAATLVFSSCFLGTRIVPKGLTRHVSMLPQEAETTRVLNFELFCSCQ